MPITEKYTMTSALGPSNGGIIKSFAAKNARGSMEEFDIKRRVPTDDDVGIEIMFCGICRSDIHMIDNDWAISNYPLVPGHEIVGIVRIVGSNVYRVSVGDHVGVGLIVDSCRKCSSCRFGAPQYCTTGSISAYSTKYDKDQGNYTFGGFSNFIVVNKKFVYSLPRSLPMAASAPLLCAGLTVYSALRRCKIVPGVEVGIVGIGGLGHLAIQIARAMGAHVTAISRSVDKDADAKKLGARNFVCSRDSTQMDSMNGKLNVILDTSDSADHHQRLIQLLKVNGLLAIVGLGTEDIKLSANAIALKRIMVMGSIIGSPSEMRELFALCDRHHIKPVIELIDKDNLSKSIDRMRKGEVKNRLVLDVRTMKKGYSEWMKTQAEQREAARKRILSVSNSKASSLHRQRVDTTYANAIAGTSKPYRKEASQGGISQEQKHFTRTTTQSIFGIDGVGSIDGSETTGTKVSPTTQSELREIRHETLNDAKWTPSKDISKEDEDTPVTI